VNDSKLPQTASLVVVMRQQVQFHARHPIDT
jgi:hypothetical protein